MDFLEPFARGLPRKQWDKLIGPALRASDGALGEGGKKPFRGSLYEVDQETYALSDSSKLGLLILVGLRR